MRLTMLVPAAIVLAVATLFGLALVSVPTLTRRWLPGAAHGLIGVGGFVLLLLSLGGPRRGVAMGAGSFGIDAALLFGGALVAALVLATARLRRRKPALLAIGLHATFAIAGITVLAAYLGFPA